MPCLTYCRAKRKRSTYSHVLLIAWRNASLSYSGRCSGVLPIAPACLPSVLGAFALPANGLVSMPCSVCNHPLHRSPHRSTSYLLRGVSFRSRIRVTVGRLSCAQWHDVLEDSFDSVTAAGVLSAPLVLVAGSPHCCATWQLTMSV